MWTRSKHETDRLHRLTKPARAPRVQDDDLPSVQSHSEDEGLWDSDIEAYLTQSELTNDGDGDGDHSVNDTPIPSDSSSSESLEVEDFYERKARKPPEKEELKGAERLPVKLPNGTIKKRGFLPVQQFEESDEELEGPTTAISHPETAPPREDVSTGARFGRPAVTAVIANKSRKARIQGAKEQLASICQDIIADPENNVCFFFHLFETLDSSTKNFSGTL
jgi:nucleolar complex protein 3